MFKLISRIIFCSIIAIIVIGISWSLLSTKDEDDSQKRFVSCLIDVGKTIDFTVHKGAKSYFLKVKEDESFSNDVRLAFIEGKTQEYLSARDQLAHFYISTGNKVPTGGPMPSLEALNSMSKDKKDKLNKQIREQIPEDARNAKNLFVQLAPNCFNSL